MLLLDEIEKAHPDLFNILLQVMDHATLTDNNGKKAGLPQRHHDDDLQRRQPRNERLHHRIGDPKKGAEGKGKKAIEKYFSPEFRNRLDATIVFNGLDKRIMEQIVDKFMAEFAIQLAARKVELTYTDAVRSWMAKRGYDPQFGARPLARVLQTHLKDVLADEILFGKLEKGGKVKVDVDGDDLNFSYQ